MAREGERYVAGALNLGGGDTLYGRQLGQPSAIPSAFRVIYYRALDFRDRARPRAREAGARRDTRSSAATCPHPPTEAWVRGQRLRRAIENFLAREARRSQPR